MGSQRCGHNSVTQQQQFKVKTIHHSIGKLGFLKAKTLSSLTSIIQWSQLPVWQWHSLGIYEWINGLGIVKIVFHKQVNFSGGKITLTKITNKYPFNFINNEKLFWRKNFWRTKIWRKWKIFGELKFGHIDKYLWKSNIQYWW